MATFNNLTDEDISNLKKFVEFQQSDGHQFPPGLLEKLGIQQPNKKGGIKAANVDEVNKRLRGNATKPVQKGHSEGSSSKKSAILKEKAHALASRSKHYEASAALEEIQAQGNPGLGTQLLMAECYLQLGRENRANKCLENIEKSLTTVPRLPANDLIDMAKDFIADSSYARAIIMLRIAADVTLNTSMTPDEMLSGVFRCCNKLGDVVKSMLKEGGRSRTIAADLGMEILQEVTDKVSGVKNCNRDEQVIKEAWCYRHIDYNYFLLSEHRKSAQLERYAIKKLEEHFTPTGAQRYHVYGWFLHNYGFTLKTMRQFDEALVAYEKALEAKENAQDYDNEIKKKKDIDESRDKLKEIRKTMGKI